jgi:hypothetical protein
MDFRYFKSSQIEQTLDGILRRWEATPEAHETFRGWAWVVASVAETYASENLQACEELLEAEKQAIHRIIAERLHFIHSVSEELVSKRTFLEFLEHSLQRSHVAHAA